MSAERAPARPGGETRRSTARTAPWLDFLRTAAESLRRDSGTTARAIGLLAIGVGAASSVASLVRVESLAPLRLSSSLGPSDLVGSDWGGWWAGVGVSADALRAEELDVLLAAVATAVGLTFLAACLAVWIQVVARGRARRRELGVRAAVGASRRRLFRELAVEGAILAVFGVGSGLGLGWATAASLPGGLPVGLSGGTHGWGIEVAVLSLVAVGVVMWASVVPIRRRFRVSTRLGAHSPVALMGAGERTSNDLLASALVALSLPLLVAAGLAVRSYIPAAADRGAQEPRTSVLLRVSGSGPSGRSRVTAAELRAVRSSVERNPRVEAVGLSTPGAWAGLGVSEYMLVQCDCARGGAILPFVRPRVQLAGAEPGFFRLMGWEARTGTLAPPRRVGEPGAHAPARSLLINRAFQRREMYFAPAVGKSVRIGRDVGMGPWYDIQGVTADAAARGLGIDEPRPIAFLPLLEHPSGRFDVLARGSLSPTETAGEVKRAVTAMLPTAEVEIRGTLEEELRKLRAPEEWLAALLTLAGALAAAVAFAGVFGATSDEMRRRRTEIGLRRAVGARRRDVSCLAVLWALWVAGAGLAAGLVVAVPLADYLRFLLPGGAFTDWGVWLGGPLLLLAAAVLGAIGPARAAGRVQPRESLGAGS